MTGMTLHKVKYNLYYLKKTNTLALKALLLFFFFQCKDKAGRKNRIA